MIQSEEMGTGKADLTEVREFAGSLGDWFSFWFCPGEGEGREVMKDFIKSTRRSSQGRLTLF